MFFFRQQHSFIRQWIGKKTRSDLANFVWQVQNIQLLNFNSGGPENNDKLCEVNSEVRNGLSLIVSGSGQQRLGAEHLLERDNRMESR